jgi:hypothetical protein
VDILMTVHDWHETVTIMWGSFDDAAKEVQQRVLGLQPNERFLLYGQYELVPSTRAPAGRSRLRVTAARGTTASGGDWNVGRRRRGRQRG